MNSISFFSISSFIPAEFSILLWISHKNSSSTINNPVISADLLYNKTEYMEKGRHEQDKEIHAEYFYKRNI